MLTGTLYVKGHDFHIRFAVAPSNFSFVSMCGSEKNWMDLDVLKQYTLFALRRDCWILTGSGAYTVLKHRDPPGSSQNHIHSQK